MAVRVKYDIPSELVKPKLTELNIKTVTEKDLKPISTVASQGSSYATANTTTATVNPQQQSKQGYKWDSWSLQLSLSNMDGAVKAIEGFLKQVDKFSKIVTQVLKIMRLLSGNVRSLDMFLKFLIKQLAEMLKTLINSFASTGVYMSVIPPPGAGIKIYGGYNEFITRVTATCTSSTDPDAPRFDSPDDKVGGLIFGMLGGVNDPKFLVDLAHNFRVLSQFFGFQSPIPDPPAKFKVATGFYKNPQTGAKAMGIQLTWEAPTTPVTGYKIYKADNPKGFMKSPKPTQDGKEISVRLPGEWIADVPNVPGKVFYRYTDFAVVEGKSYYYKVYSLMGDSFFDDTPLMEDIRSPVATAMLSVQPRNHIPLSELTKYTLLGVNGELASPFDLEGQWQSISVRGLLGSSLDAAFRQIDAMADKLAGMVNTSSSAMTDYIDFYAKRVSTFLDIVTEFRELVVRLKNYSMRGTVMLLRLPIKSGGMQNFVSRFKEASSMGNAESGAVQTQSLQSMLAEDRGQSKIGTPFSFAKGGGIAQYTEKGYMFGVILLFGFPSPSAKNLLAIVSPDEIDNLKAQLETTEKAITTLMKLLGLG